MPRNGRNRTLNLAAFVENPTILQREGILSWLKKTATTVVRKTINR